MLVAHLKSGLLLSLKILYFISLFCWHFFVLTWELLRYFYRFCQPESEHASLDASQDDDDQIQTKDWTKDKEDDDTQIETQEEKVETVGLLETINSLDEASLLLKDDQDDSRDFPNEDMEASYSKGTHTISSTFKEDNADGKTTQDVITERVLELNFVENCFAEENQSGNQETITESTVSESDDDSDLLYGRPCPEVLPSENTKGVDLLQEIVRKVLPPARNFEKSIDQLLGVVDSCIGNFENLAKYMDSLQLDTTIARTSGIAASIIGGGLFIGGGIASILTFGAATPLMIAGAAVLGPGIAVNVGGGIAKIVLNNRTFKEAEKCWEEFNETTKILADSKETLTDSIEQLLKTKEFMEAHLTQDDVSYIAFGLCDTEPNPENKRLEWSEAATRFGLASHVGREWSESGEMLSSFRDENQRSPGTSMDVSLTVARSALQVGGEATKFALQTGPKVAGEIIGRCLAGVTIGLNVAMIAWDIKELVMTSIQLHRGLTGEWKAGDALRPKVKEFEDKKAMLKEAKDDIREIRRKVEPIKQQLLNDP